MFPFGTWLALTSNRIHYGNTKFLLKQEVTK
jgi:hypothetical protein